MNGKSRISETNITQAALIRDSLSLSHITSTCFNVSFSLLFLSLPSLSFFPLSFFFFPHFSPNLSLETG